MNRLKSKSHEFNQTPESQFSGSTMNPTFQVDITIQMQMHLLKIKIWPKNKVEWCVPSYSNPKIKGPVWTAWLSQPECPTWKKKWLCHSAKKVKVKKEVCLSASNSSISTSVPSLSLFVPVLLRECYSTPCNVRVCLTGWMRSVSLRVVRVGRYFLEGSAKQLHSYHASARNKIYRGRQDVQI